MVAAIGQSRAASRHAVATAWIALLFAAACTPVTGTTAVSQMLRIRNDTDPNLRYLAYDKLADPRCYDHPQQKHEAALLLIKKYQEGREPDATRAIICRTLGVLRDPAARDVLAAAANDPKAVVRVQGLRALGSVGKPEDATILVRAMVADTLNDCKIAAVEGLGELKSSDPRINQVLVSNIENDDPAIRRAVYLSLCKISGTDLGGEIKPWEEWLARQQPKDDASKKETAAAAAPPVEKARVKTSSTPRPRLSQLAARAWKRSTQPSTATPRPIASPPGAASASQPALASNATARPAATPSHPAADVSSSSELPPPLLDGAVAPAANPPPR